MRYTAGEVRTNSQTMFPNGPIHTDKQELGDQLELIFNSSIRIQDAA